MLNTNNKFLVIGGDRRYDFLSRLLSDKCEECIRISSPEELGHVGGEGFEAVLPYPLSPDGISIMLSDGGMSVSKLFSVLTEMGVKRVYAGAVKDGMRTLAESVGLDIVDYGRDEALLQKNALCSAEGAIHILMRELDKTLHGAKFTVVGYGRIGRVISYKLKAMGADVSAVARRAESYALMELDGVEAFDYSEFSKASKGCDAVINTVPYHVLCRAELSVLDKKAFVLDLASSPGGVNREAAEELGIKVIWALSIPGKYCPQTASEIIYDAIMRSRKVIGD